ncbi:MAG: lipid A phosphoethanolamine transferase [Flavobacterium sp.]
MKNLLTLILFTLCICYSASAQIDETPKNPFTGARINYFKHTVLVTNEYLDLNNGSYNTTNMRLILPIGSKHWNLRADIPIVSKNNDQINKTGLGDFSFGATYIPYIDTKKGIAIRTRVITNSSDDPNFGTGKWVVLTALFYGQYIGSTRNYLWISIIENQTSFAGSNNRNEINITSYENLVFRYFGKNWIAGDVNFRYNTIVDGFQNTAFIEYGRKLTPSNMVYIHPSVAFGGEKSYNYGFEVGFFILF